MNYILGIFITTIIFYILISLNEEDFKWILKLKQHSNTKLYGGLFVYIYTISTIGIVIGHCIQKII
jgi:hypothetical protein